MYLKAVGAVFKLIFILYRFRGKLSRFTHRDKPLAQRISNGASKDKAPGLNAHYIIYIHPPVSLYKPVDDLFISVGVINQGCYIPEHYTLFGKIGYCPYL